MAGLILRNVCKSYANGFHAVKDFNLEIQDGEFLIFVGPSGCGKSTTLRMIAGLEDITSGELWIDGKLSNFLEPGERGLSMVFQNYALYPHMTVYDNMAFGLKVRKLEKGEIEKRVREAARILEIEHLLDRRPAALSGGQKQRVAIGSVIVRQPKAYLMDEPLSNLDAKLRTQMRVELSKLHSSMKTTIIYVTHDQVEAMTLGSRIVVMKEGRIQQVAAPADLYQNPINQFVAGFIGSPSMNFFEAKVEKEQEGVFLRIESQRVRVNSICAKKLLDNGYLGRDMILGIRPEDLHAENTFEGAAELTHNGLRVQVQVREMLGAEVLLHGLAEGEKFSASVSRECTAKPGEETTLYLDMNRAKLFDVRTGANLLYRRNENEDIRIS